jgi:hypothetical protein
VVGVLCSCVVHGQTSDNLLPTKSEGKWGYINLQKTWVIPPQYDFCLGFEGRDFTWVKTGDKSQLIDRKGNTTQSLPFNSITAIHDDIIIYRDKNLLGWFDKSTNKTVSAQYSHLEYLPRSSQFITHDTTHYGVVDVNNNQIIPGDSITEIIFNQFYFIQRHNRFGVYNTDGGAIIPEKYEHIKQYQDYFIAQESTGQKHIYDKSGVLIYGGYFTEISPIYGDYFQCARDKKKFLLESTSGELLDSTSGRYSFFRNGLIDIKDNNGRGLYNVDLKKRVLNPSYVGLFNQNGSSYIITYDGSLFGLIDSAGNQPNDAHYTSIGPFQTDVCIVRDMGKYGLIGRQAQTLLPSKYSYISVGDDGIVKAKKDSIFFLFEFDKDGKVLDSMRFNRTGTLRLGGTITMSMVNGVRSSAQQISGYWFQDSKGKWGLRDQTGAVKVRPIYDEVIKLRGTDLVLGKIFTTRTAKLTRRMGIMSSTTYGVVDEQKFRPVVYSGIMYIDTSTLGDPNTQVMRIISGGAYFGTINKKTGRVLRYESKYVGKFENGYARIFMGTKLVLTSKPKFCIVANSNNYLSEFNFTSRGAPLNRWQLQIDGIGFWGYLGPDGKFIRSPKFFKSKKIVTASDFRNGRAIIKNNEDYYGMIDQNANYILEPIYQDISFLRNSSDSLVKTVTLKRRYGYVGEDGNVISPVQYSRALPFESDATWCFTDYTTCLLRNDGTQDTFHGINKVSPFYNGYGGLADLRKMAVITSKGDLQTVSSYSKLGKFSEDLMPAKKSTTFGYIDDEGTWIIQPEFYKAGPFVNGIAMVRYSSKTSSRKFYGYINRSGELILKGKLTRAEDINKNGYALVKKGNLSGVVNSSGKLIIKPRYSKIHFGEGYYTTFNNGITTLRDKEGKKIRKIRASRVKSGVKDGKQVVKRLRQTGAINVAGETVVDFSYSNLTPFENGISIIQRGKKAYVLHESGDTLAILNGRSICGFNSEYVLIRSGKNYFFANHSGKIAMNLFFKKVEPFEDGIARVMVNNQWGLIDKDGFFRIQPYYDFIERPTSGVCIVGLNKTSGVCDLNASYVIAPRCNSITYLPNEKVYQYSYKNEFGYIDRKGKIIWEVK